VTTSFRFVLMRRVFALYVLGAVGCSTSPSVPFESLSRQFVHRVPFEIGQFESLGEDRIEILEVWGTRPTIEPGGDYVVVGRCVVSSADDATVDLSLTSTKGWKNVRTGADLASAKVTRGESRFVLHHDMPGPGFFHVSLSTRDETPFRRVANVYFGLGESLLTRSK